MALARSLGSSRRQFLLAAVAGYEVASRIARAADAGIRAQGFHSTGAVGPFGACASACVLLGLDAGRTAHALSPAGPEPQASDSRMPKVRDAVRLVEREGWSLARIRESHRHDRHPEKPGGP